MRKGLSCIGLWLCLLLIIGCSNSDSQPENVEVYLEANTDRVLLKEEGGTAYINIASNTRWTILVENDEIPVIDLDVTPLAGDGDGTIKITYGREINKVQCEHATLIFYYYSEGKRVSKEVILTRQMMVIKMKRVGKLLQLLQKLQILFLLHLKPWMGIN